MAGSFPVVFVSIAGRGAPRWPDAVREGLSTAHYRKLCPSTLYLTWSATCIFGLLLLRFLDKLLLTWWQWKTTINIVLIKLYRNIFYNARIFYTLLDVFRIITKTLICTCLQCCNVYPYGLRKTQCLAMLDEAMKQNSLRTWCRIWPYTI